MSEAYLLSSRNCFRASISMHVFLQPKELVGFLVLLNQLICKFSTSVHGILEDVFPTIVSRIFNIIPRDSLPSGPGTNIEVLLLCVLILNLFRVVILLNVVFKIAFASVHMSNVVSHLVYAHCFE